MDSESRSSGHTGSASTGELVRDILEDVSALVRMEIDLAKEEISELIGAKVRAMVLGGLAVVFAVLIVPMLVLTSVEILAIWLDRWAAAAIMTGAITAASLVAFLAAKNRMDAKFLPEKSLASIKEDLRWARSLKRP